MPFVINFLDGGFFFISAYRFAKAGCPALVCGSGVTCWGLVYCIVSMFLGKIVNTGNALKFIISGGTILSLSSAGFMVFDALFLQFLWLGLAGVGAALFCTPFQLFAKSLESSENSVKPDTARATAFYTASWSIGLASGPLVFARLPYKTGFLITLCLAVGVTLLLGVVAFLLKNNRAKSDNIEGEEKQSGYSTEYISAKSRLAVLGWIIGVTGTFAVSIVRALWPKHADLLEISRDHAAYILALVSYSQAVTAILFCKSKRWMYSKSAAVWMGLVGILPLLGFAFGEGMLAFYFSAAAFGVYTGSIYFYLVFHSLDHPEKPQYFVAGNEVLVGLTCIIAPLAGGITVDCSGLSGSGFVLSAGVVLVTMVVQLAVLKRLALEKQGII